jgi:protein tyrosine/serine phosphatase
MDPSRRKTDVAMRGGSSDRVTHRIRALAIAAILIAALAPGAWLASLQLTGNIHTIEPGMAYRSAQLNASALSEVVRLYGIRAIVNLRPFGAGDEWYRNEIETSRSLDVEHIDFPMSANEDAGVDRLHALVDLLRRAPKPILIHCKSGADRSGLAAALYEYAIAMRSAETASRQLTVWYGHVPYLWSRTGAMDRSFEDFVSASTKAP